MSPLLLNIDKFQTNNTDYWQLLWSIDEWETEHRENFESKQLLLKRVAELINRQI